MSVQIANGTDISVSETDGGPYSTSLCVVTGFAGPSATKDEIETTAICATSRAFIAGLRDFGEVSCDANYDPSHAGYQLVRDNFDADSNTDLYFQFTFPDGTVATFAGWIMSIDRAGSSGGLLTANFTIRCTSAWTEA